MKIHTYASVDIGSNAIRLLINRIYEYENDKHIFNKTSLVRIPIRIGQDTFTTGIISAQTVDKISDAMKAVSLLMKLYDVQHSKVFATSAVRDSKNGKEVIKEVFKRTNIQIEIIDGETEANIILKTNLDKFKNSNLHYLFVDVGGGSTEISLLFNGEVLASKSFKVGTVRFLNGAMDENILENEIKPFVKKICKDKEVELIGSGGNINYIFKTSKYKDGIPLPYSKIKYYLNIFSSITYEERMEFYNMKPDRADVIIPALTIYNSIMKWSNAKKIHIPKIGAADGMIQYMYFLNNK